MVQPNKNLLWSKCHLRILYHLRILIRYGRWTQAFWLRLGLEVGVLLWLLATLPRQRQTSERMAGRYSARPGRKWLSWADGEGHMGHGHNCSVSGETLTPWGDYRVNICKYK